VTANALITLQFTCKYSCCRRMKAPQSCWC